MRSFLFFLAFLASIVFTASSLLAQQPLYVPPGGLVPFGLNGQSVTVLRADGRAGIDEPAPLIAGTKADGLFGIFPFDTLATWQRRGFSGRGISALNLQRWGAGPFEAISVQTSVLYSADSTREYVSHASISGGSFPSDTSWVKADNDTAKQTLRWVRAIAGGNYSGHEPPVPVLAGGRYGVVRLGTDSASAPAAVGLGSMEISALAHDRTGFGGTLLAGGNGFIYRSTDEGATWNLTQFSQYGGGVIALGVTQGDTGYAAARESIWRSTDDGQTWEEKLVAQGDFIKTLAVDPINPRHVFATTSYSGLLLQSNDGGTNWKLIHDSTGRAIISMALFYPGSRDSLPYLFLGTDGNGVWVYRVPDDTVHPPRLPFYYPLAVGNLWSYRGYSSFGQEPRWLDQREIVGDTVFSDGKKYSMFEEYHGYQEMYERQEGDSVFVASDWSGATLLFDFTKTVDDLISLEDGYRYVDGTGDTLLFGRRLRWWSFLNQRIGPVYTGQYKMVVVDSIGLVEEWGYDDFGGYHWTLSGAVIDGQQYGVIDGVDEQDGPDELPKATRLEQCFPNPFNPATVIGYRVGQGEDLGTGRLGEGGSVLVQLSVYDILGREVATLVNERQAPGSYTVTFDGAGLASGVYLYRLQAGGFTETKRMMLVR